MRRQAVSELQTKPAVHCTDPAAPRASPRRSPKFNRSFPAVCFDSNTAANDKRGSVWPRCSVRWRVGLLQALRRKSMCTVNAASVEPAGREEVSGLARLKPGSARALLKREWECCSDRPEKVNCQPGWFGRPCFEKQRRRSGYGFTTAWRVSSPACLKAGGGSFGQLERCSSECQSVAQTDQGERSTRLGWIGMFRWYVLPGQQGKKHVSGVAGLKPWSARAWRRRELERGSDWPEKVTCQPGLIGRHV